MIKKKAVMTNAKVHSYNKSAFTQLGDTMVSMAGVLLIMAVMVIGVIQVYQFFIRSAKVQNTARMIMTLALERQNSAINEETGGRIRVPGAYATLFIENGTEGKFAPYFWIDTTLADKAFCEGLKKSELIKADVVMVNDSANGTCPGKVAFYFKKNPFGNEKNLPLCDDDSACGECEHCGNRGICEGCIEGETCTQTFEEPGGNRMCYPNENLVDGLYCAFPDNNGGCNECAQDTDCTTDPAKQYCNSNTGKCQACEGGNLKQNNGVCYPCDGNTIALSTSYDECLTCQGDRFYRNDSYPGCIRCDTTTKMPSTRFSCLSCPSRFMKGDSETGTCYYCNGNVNDQKNECYSNCPAGQFYNYSKGQQSACEECQASTIQIESNPTECRKCAGIRFWRNSYDQCVLCNYNGVFHSNLRSDCLSCPQRYMPGTAETGSCSFCSGFVSGDGTACYACDKAEAVETSEARCKQCKGQRYYNNGVCSACPADISGLTLAQQAECTPVGENNDCGENPCILYDNETQTCKNKCTQVQYLQSTGTQYINTGYVPTGNTGTEIKFLITGWGNGSDANLMMVGGDSAGYRWGFGYRSSSAVTFGYTLQVSGICAKGASWENYPMSTKTVHTVTYNYDNQKKCYLDGSLIRESIPYGTATPTYPIFIFTSNQNGSSWRPGAFQLYYCKMVENGTLVRDFIPVLDPSGTPAMYDKVSGALFYNQGSGSFSYGPVVN